MLLILLYLLIISQEVFLFSKGKTLPRTKQHIKITRQP